jgi:hypothetical protein
VATGSQSTARKARSGLRCSNGHRCVAYPALGEPAKLSRGNPGPRCFACEERRSAAQLEVTAAKPKAVEPRKTSGTPHPEVSRALAVRDRRRAWVLTCERELRSAIASGDERLVRKWSKLSREAEARLAWAEADFQTTKGKTSSKYAH